jgi:hypothetical protein
LKQIFPEKELRGLSPKLHIHVSVSDLYITTIGLPILLQENMWTNPGSIKIAHSHINFQGPIRNNNSACVSFGGTGAVSSKSDYWEYQPQNPISVHCNENPIYVFPGNGIARPQSEFPPIFCRGKITS